MEFTRLKSRRAGIKEFSTTSMTAFALTMSEGRMGSESKYESGILIA